MTELAIRLNDHAGSTIRFDVDTLPDDLTVSVHQWLNGDYDAASDAMSFSPTHGGSVTLHRSQVLYITVGRVRFNGKSDAPALTPEVLPDLPPPPAPLTYAPPVASAPFPWKDLAASVIQGQVAKRTPKDVGKGSF